MVLQLAAVEQRNGLLHRICHQEPLRAALMRIGGHQSLGDEIVDRLGLMERFLRLHASVVRFLTGAALFGLGEPGTLGLLFGEIALAGGDHRLPARSRRAGQQHDKRRRHAADQHLVPLGELANLIKLARRTGDHGLIAQVPLDVRSKFQRRLIASLLLLGQRLADHDLDVAAEDAADRGERRRIVFPDHADRVVDHLVPKIVRQPTGQQFVGDDAESVHVAAGIKIVRITAGLLRTHVGHCADDLADIGLPRGGLDIGVGRPGHAEIKNLRLSRGIYQDVSRLEVAVDDALLMSVMNALANLRHQLKALARAQLVLVGELRERLALDKLHREKRLGASTGVVGAGLVDSCNAGMLQAAEDVRFELKSLEGLGRNHAGLDDL